MAIKAPYLVPWIVLCSLSMASGQLPAVTFQLVPVSADERPRRSLSSPEWRIEGNELFLDHGGRPVWFEIWMSDWDPNEAAIRIKSFRATIDDSGYASGQTGILAPYQFACSNNDDCSRLLGSESDCRLGESTPYCNSGFIAFRSLLNSGTNYLFWGARIKPEGPSRTVDRTSLDYVYQGVLGGDPVSNFTCVGGYMTGGVCDPNVCVATLDYCPMYCPSMEILGFYSSCVLNHSERYLGTLVLWVPPEAEGTFTINLKPYPDTALIDEFDQPFPLELIPAKVTVGVSACCYKVDTPSPGCIDDLNLAECEALAGATAYHVGGTCAEDPCSALAHIPCCLEDHSCAILPRQDCLAQNGSETIACVGDGDGDGRDDLCDPDPDPVPAASHWGVIIIVLALATLARVRFRRAVRLQAL